MPRIKVDITHPDRLLFPADRITKGELVDYYAAVAEVMVPHMKGRPLTLWRYPRGIDQQGFVQQDFAGTLPDWMGSAGGGQGGRDRGAPGCRPPRVRGVACQPELRHAALLAVAA